MKNPLSSLDSIQIGKPGKVLVLHSDGYRLVAALVQTGVAGAVIRARAESRAIDPQIAVAEAVAALREQGVRRLPKKATLMSTSALTALLDLPVDPDHPRPREQMHELVRWELESLFSEQGLRWTIGAPLMGRGYLTPEQRAALAARQEQLLREYAADPERVGTCPRIRFGDLAVECKFATREQVEECVELRDQLFRAEDQLVCGWVGQSRPLGDEATDDAEDDGQGFPWLTIGIPENLRRTWVKACQRQGLFLDTVYSILGVGFGMLEVPAGGEALYLEVHPEQFAVMRGQPGGLCSLRIGNTHDGRLTPEDAVGLCREELRPEIKRLHLRAPDDQAEALTLALGELLGLEVVRTGAPAATTQVAEGESEIPLPTKEAPGKGGKRRKRRHEKEAPTPATPVQDKVADEILAVARHLLGTAPRSALASVQAQPPRPPLWKRRELLPYAAAAGVVLAVIGNDVRMRLQVWHNEGELDRLDSVYEQQMEEKRIATEIANEGNRLEGEVAEHERVVADLSTRVSGLQHLTSRRERLPRELEQIAAACNDEMVLQEINLPSNPGALVQLRGWSLTSTAAQLFVATLNNTLAELGGKVRNSRIVAAPGPRNLSGYQVEVWLAFAEGGER